MKLIKLFNIYPSGHEVGWVYGPKGIAPTVRENYGKITLVLINEKQKRCMGSE